MDAGLSGKKTKDLLAQVGVDIKDIDMIFISHDHTDHSGGLGVLMRRYPQISAYANSGTWNYLIESKKIGNLPVERSEEHTSELQSRFDLVCRLLLEKKKKKH